MTAAISTPSAGWMGHRSFPSRLRRIRRIQLCSASPRRTFSTLINSLAQSRSMKREPELPSAGGVTAVDVEDMAGDERSFVRRDEDDRVGKLFREAEAAHRKDHNGYLFKSTALLGGRIQDRGSILRSSSRPFWGCASGVKLLPYV